MRSTGRGDLHPHDYTDRELSHVQGELIVINCSVSIALGRLGSLPINFDLPCVTQISRIVMVMSLKKLTT